MLRFGSKSDINVNYKCTVRLLDDTEVLECEFQTHHKGTFLLEHVCKQLNVVEKDYFGLRYVDVTKQRHWLDLEKTILKQIKDMNPILFSFRVKFYPPNPVTLYEDVTRYQVYLQLKRDLLHGRLYCSQNEAAELGAYIVQAELGDYNPEVFVGNYVAEMKLLLKQTQVIEEKILELHKTQLQGQSPLAMEFHFLKTASQLDTYGIDPHPVKDHKGTLLYLGVNHLGVLTFHGNRKTRHFNWSEIQKINYEGKMFIIHLVYYEDSRTKKKHTVGFKCPTAAACRFIWRSAVEQMLFFTLQKSSDAPVMTGGGLFSWGTKFRYSGKTEKEILRESRCGKVSESGDGSRSGTLEGKASSEPATPSTPLGSEHNENGTDDYCFRNSFDRSSCDTQLPDTLIHSTATSSHKKTSARLRSPCRSRLIGRAAEGGELSRRTCNLSREKMAETETGKVPSPKKFNLFQVFIPSLLCVAISLVTATVLILESDSDILSGVRETPEMITLRKHYYEPLKEFLMKTLLNFE